MEFQWHNNKRNKSAKRTITTTTTTPNHFCFNTSGCPKFYIIFHKTLYSRSLLKEQTIKPYKESKIVFRNASTASWDPLKPPEIVWRPCLSHLSLFCCACTLPEKKESFKANRNLFHFLDVDVYSTIQDDKKPKKYKATFVERNVPKKPISSKETNGFGCWGWKGLLWPYPLGNEKQTFFGPSWMLIVGLKVTSWFSSWSIHKFDSLWGYNSGS